MAHSVSGFDLTYTSRTSWKAKRSYGGKVLDIVPVAWTHGRRQDPETGDVFQEVWYQDQGELQERTESRDPFIVAIAECRDFSEHPRVFKCFRGVFRVVATGQVLSSKSVETKVLNRVTAKDMQSAPRS